MQKTNLNIAPIFDDFDESKNFHRVLFNAGKSVQARELTQAQSILQAQIERIGKHLFTEGSMVVPGGFKAIEAQDYVTLTMTGGSVFTDFSTEAELYIKSTTNSMIYKVAKSINAAGADPITLFVDFLSPGAAQQKTFTVGEAVTLFTMNPDGSQVSKANATIQAKGQGSWVKVQSGVYFVRGMLVRTDDQEYIVSKYTTDTTKKVGFTVQESIVNSSDDASLFSNAIGYPNQNASGADRLKIQLVLTGLDVGAVDSNFIEIARFDGGSLSNKIDYTQYSVIEQAIARRTYETNGDYVVNQFGLDVKEHLNTGTNNGVYTAPNGGDSTKLVAAVRPGVGYVKGYRVENIGIQNVVVDKARDTAFLNNASASADYGQYFLCSNVLSLPDIDIKKKILLLDSGNVQVGTARVRAIRKDGTQYRFYVFDVSLNAGKIMSNVAKIKYTDVSSLFTADLAVPGLYDSGKGSLLFKLPISAVKSLYQAGIGSDTSYTVLRSFTLTTNSSGVVSATVGANEFFSGVDDINWFIALTGSASAGTQFVPSGSVTLGGTIMGTTATIDLGVGQANKTIKLIAPVLKSATTQKSKTLLTITDEVIAFPDTNRQRFTKSDIFDIVSVKDNTTNADITSLFTFDNGQRDSWYESGRLVVKDGSLITRTVKVTYRYFAHSAGDYFTVDSYTGLAREQIPSYGGNNLSDYVDFRPLKDSADDFTSSTVFGEILKPASTISADITYYLPRNDLIVVDKDGVFRDVRGISSLSPVTPDTPAEAMKLFELYIPAYTLSTSDVTVKTVDNKRYTMRDIGKLESRIANIEYYTTLNALETNTNKTNVIDPVTGNNRFKNGFAVDGFADYRMADVEHPEWSASLDLNGKKLKSSFVQNAVSFAVNSLANAIKPSKVFLKSYSETPVVDQPYATTTININPYAVFGWIGDVALTPDRDYWKDTVYAQPIIINNTIDFRGRTVEGLFWGSWIKTTYDELGGHRDWARQQYKAYQYQTVFQETNYSSSTESVVATQVIPFMRSIQIAFKCTGFRPFTRLYPFWDNVDVAANCTPSGGALGGNIVTDATGTAIGTFTVPTGVFKTGESVFRFTDDPTNDVNVGTTSGSTTFLSGGITETRQVTTSNTKVLTSTTVQTGAVTYNDPIAQTFIVPNEGGCFVTKFDIFFSSKARSLPVTLQLRTAYSGLPTSDILAKVTLNPAQVNTSADGTVATSFTFADPVFLEEGREYAVVLEANTQEYNVFIAVQGQNVIGANMALSKQAYMGVFLTSSNSSTWSAHQDTDLKFKLHRAVFNTAVPSVVTLDCGAPTTLPLTSDALFSTSGSNLVKLRFKSHGLKAGDSVTVAGAVAGNGLLDAGLNGTKTVLSADIDSVTYQATTNATATGSLGGAVMTALVNYPFNILVNNVDSFAPTGTSVSWEYQYKTQATRIASGWLPLSPTTDIKLPSEGVVKAAGDVQIRATLTTTKDNLSPVIESSGFNAVLVSPRVDSASKVMNYVSTDIKFNNATTQAKFYVGARLPNGSGMKFYVKRLDTADQDIAATAWTELAATTPIANSEGFVEYEYALTGNFVGYKIKVELTGSRDNPPELSDVRSLAFA
jgi:hypothetical protein